MSNAARNHPLFPMLDYMVRETLQNRQAIQSVEETVKKVDKNLTLVKNAVDELKELIEKQQRGSFNLKEFGFQVSVYSCFMYLRHIPSTF